MGCIEEVRGLYNTAMKGLQPRCLTLLHTQLKMQKRKRSKYRLGDKKRRSSKIKATFAGLARGYTHKCIYEGFFLHRASAKRSELGNVFLLLTTSAHSAQARVF